MAINFTVNGKAASTDAPPATPLLWMLREGLKLTGTKYGCGTGLCGACMVHIDGKRGYSCQTRVSEVANKSVTTIEGLSADSSHPLQKAWLAEQVPQCGYCQSGHDLAGLAIAALRHLQRDPGLLDLFAGGRGTDGLDRGDALAGRGSDRRDA